MRMVDLEQVMGNERGCYTQPWPAWLMRLVLRSGASCWVVEGAGGVLGHGVVNLEPRGAAHIMNICIAAPYRRRGLGRKLLAHMLQVARARGARQVWLEVRPDNGAAITLYRRMGFRKAGVRKGYYREGVGRLDALVMVAELVPEGNEE